MRGQSMLRDAYARRVAALAYANGGAGSTATIQALADPLFLSSFMNPATDISGGLVDVDLAFGRFAASAPFTAGETTWLKLDSLQRLTQLRGFSGVTGYAFNQANPAVVPVPSESSLRVTGAGSGGVIQCKGSNPAAFSLIFQSVGPNNHGEFDIEDFWMMGDPTLMAGVVDADGFMRIGPFFSARSRRCRWMGFLAGLHVLEFSGTTQIHATDMHLGGCGALQAGGPTASVAYFLGNEFGQFVDNWIFLVHPSPPNVPANVDKSQATPKIFRDQSDAAAFTGAGDFWGEIQFGDPSSAGLVVNPQGAGNGVGPQFCENLYLDANSADPVGSGAVYFAHVQGGVYYYGGRTRLNGSTVVPAINFAGDIPYVEVKQHRVDFGFGYFFQANGGQVGDAYFDQCSTDQANPNIPIFLATATIATLPGVAVAPPATLRMKLTGTAQTTNAAQTATAVQIPTLPGMSLTAIAKATCRSTTTAGGGTTGDTRCFVEAIGAKNIAGVVSSAKNDLTGANGFFDASLNAASIAVANAAPLVNVNVNQGAAVGNNNTWGVEVDTCAS